MTAAEAQAGKIMPTASWLQLPDAPGQLDRGYRPRLTGSLRRAWYVGCVLFGAQFAVLCAWSWHLWSRFSLTADMATFAQAWEQIATGHLDPYLTTFAYYYPHWGYPYYQSHLELIMWPLAALYWVWPHTIDLLIVQDGALAGAGLVTYRWGLEHIDEYWRQRSTSLAPAAILGVILLASPWTYWVASFDFHFEPLGAFFVMVAGRDLWHGHARGWAWVAIVLLCGDVAATYLLGLGLAALVSGRQLWRRGVVLLVVGAAWQALVGAVHSGKGSSLPTGYGYLAHHPINAGLGGILAIGVGILTHPGTPIHALSTRRNDIYKFLAGAGTVGVLSPLGAGFLFMVLFPVALNASLIFISDIAAFQALIAVLAGGLGVVFFMSWLARRRRSPFGLVAALGLGAFAVVQTVIMSAHWVPIAKSTFARVDASTAQELAQVVREVPARAEAVVSQGVMGRFGKRHLIYPYLDVFANGETVPLFGRTVYVVIVPQQGIESAPVAGSDAAIALLRHLGANEFVHRDGVDAFAWHVPARRHRLTFPPA